jgi:hypothetical protein
MTENAKYTQQLVNGLCQVHIVSDIGILSPSTLLLLLLLLLLMMMMHLLGERMHGV